MAARVDPIHTYRIPKPGGGTRLMAELSGADDAAWRDLAEEVAMTLEPRLSERVMANRVRFDDRGWRLAPLGRSLRAARRAAGSLSSGAPLLLRTDISACYPSMRPSAVDASLRASSVDRSIARRAADLLDGWGSGGYAGLPIGPPASAVVANAVLAAVDDSLRGTTFLRWVDDYLVRCDSEHQASEVLDRLDDALRGVGLTRSETKTTLSEGGQSFRWPGTLSLAASSKMPECDER